MKCVNIKLWDIQGCFHYILNAPRKSLCFFKALRCACCFDIIITLINFKRMNFVIFRHHIFIPIYIVGAF